MLMLELQRLGSVQVSGFPPHLENLEKQIQTWKTWKNRGFWGKNLEKYCKTWKKNFDLALKKPKSLNRKNIWKKNPAQGRGQLFYIILKQSLPKTSDNSKFIL